MGLWDRVKGYVKSRAEEERKKDLKQRLKDAFSRTTMGQAYKAIPKSMGGVRAYNALTDDDGRPNSYYDMMKEFTGPAKLGEPIGEMAALATGGYQAEREIEESKRQRYNKLMEAARQEKDEEKKKRLLSYAKRIGDEGPSFTQDLDIAKMTPKRTIGAAVETAADVIGAGSAGNLGTKVVGKQAAKQVGKTILPEIGAGAAEAGAALAGQEAYQDGSAGDIAKMGALGAVGGGILGGIGGSLAKGSLRKGAKKIGEGLGEVKKYADESFERYKLRKGLTGQADDTAGFIKKDTTGTILPEYKDPDLSKKFSQARAYKSKLEKEIPAPTRSFEPTVAKVESLNVNTGRSDISRAQVEKAKKAIKAGKVKPIVFDKSGGLYDGHHRVIAARELGEDNLPAVLRHETEFAIPKDVEEASKKRALGAFSVIEKEADSEIKKTSLKDKLKEAITSDKESQAGFIRNPFVREGGEEAVQRGGPDAVTDVSEKVPQWKLINAVEEIKPLKAEKEALQTKELGERIRRAEEVTGDGEEWARNYMKQFKGKLAEIDEEGLKKIQNKFNQEDVDALFRKVKRADLGTFEYNHAIEGLRKLIGQKELDIPNTTEIKALDKVFGKEVTDAMLGQQTTWEKAGDVIMSAINIPRAVMASFDLSAPFRQGAFMVGRKEFWKSLPGMVKDAFSEKSFIKANEEINSRETYPLMKEAGLDITELAGDLSKREEAYMSDLAERIPIIGRFIKGSGRAHTGFLNRLRADAFENIIKKGPADNKEFLEATARYVNAATGRGDIPATGGLNRANQLLNSIFFSPKLTMSRFRLADPIEYARMRPEIRKEAAKDLLKSTSAALTTMGMFKMAYPEAEIETDPTSSDFAKVKIGNTRYDLLAGFQQPIRLIARLILGKKKSSTTGEIQEFGEEYGGPTRRSEVSQFFEYKLSPTASYINSLLKGTNWKGEPVDIKKETLSRLTPIVGQDVYDAAKEEGMTGVIKSLPAFFGVGVQTYGGEEDGESSLSPGIVDTGREISPMEQGGETIESGIIDKSREVVPRQ